MSTPPATETREILAAAEQGVLETRRAAVADLQRLLAWADAHSGDPQAEPGAIPVKYGGPRLIAIGGEGTPRVEDLCFGEIAIAREAGMVATENATADALDLRHRLPHTWAGIQELACEPWVGCKVARMSRKLSREAVTVVDTAVAAALTESPWRILAIAEAKVAEADPAAHRQRIADNRAKRGVWLSQPRPGDEVDDLEPTAGVRTLTGRLDEADALELHAAVEDLADALATHDDHDPDQPPTRDQLRADALALLGRPEDALALLNRDADCRDDESGLDTGSLVPHEPYSTNDGSADHDDEGTTNEGTTGDEDSTDDDPAAPGDEADAVAGRGAAEARGGVSRPPRRRAVIHVHLAADAITGKLTSGTARVDGLGPRLLSELAALLRRCDLTLQPVIDLNHTHQVNGYEHPTTVRDRTELRVHGDAFPHTTSSASRPGQIDHDHPTPYDRDGPPGQTGDHNDAPLTRRHHRAKTHCGYRVDQLALGTYRWQTPHGLTRVVTPSGTRKVDLITTKAGDTIGEIYHPPFTIELDWRE